MTKITDIPGAKEALPEKKSSFDEHNYYKPYPQYLEIPMDEKYKREGYNKAINEVESIHLEVDVGAVGKAIDKTMPCNCIPAYKDRGLSAPDCPNCNYKEDLVDLFVKLTGARLVEKTICPARMRKESKNERR